VQDPPNFTKIGIFGLKISHLATLLLTVGGVAFALGTEDRGFDSVRHVGIPQQRNMCC
jgi:hypothetical protein